MRVNPIKYWRHNKSWDRFVGKTGKVLLSTKIEVASPELQSYLPYCFSVVEMEGKKYEFMGEKGVDLKKGDKVEFVLRRIGEFHKASLVKYGIKLVKI